MLTVCSLSFHLRAVRQQRYCYRIHKNQYSWRPEISNTTTKLQHCCMLCYGANVTAGHTPPTLLHLTKLQGFKIENHKIRRDAIKIHALVYRSIKLAVTTTCPCSVSKPRLFSFTALLTIQVYQIQQVLYTGSLCYNGSFNLYLTSALHEGSTPRPGRITPGKENRYPWYNGQCGPQDRSVPALLP